jgi:hypothetical protein
MSRRAGDVSPLFSDIKSKGFKKRNSGLLPTARRTILAELAPYLAFFGSLASAARTEPTHGSRR